MKFIANRKELAMVASKVSGVASSRNIKPILQNLVIEASKDQVYLYATDLTRFLLLFVRNVEVKIPGRMAVDADAFASYVNLLDSEKIEISGNQQLLIRGGKHATTLFCPDANEYPDIPKPGKDWFDFPVNILSRITELVSGFSGDDSAKPILRSVFFNTELGRCVATNSIRSSFLDVKFPVEIGSYAIQTLGMELIPTVSDEGTIQVQFGTHWNFFKGNRGLLGLIAVDGIYPAISDYPEKLKKNKPAAVLTLNKQHLTKVLEIVSYFFSLSKNSKSVALAWDDDIRVQLEIAELCKVDDIIQGEYSGNTGEIRFRPEHLLKACQLVSGETVKITLWGPASPILIQDSKNSEWQFAFMPIGDSEALKDWEKRKKDLVQQPESEEF